MDRDGPADAARSATGAAASPETRPTVDALSVNPRFAIVVHRRRCSRPRVAASRRRRVRADASRRVSCASATASRSCFPDDPHYAARVRPITGCSRAHAARPLRAPGATRSGSCIAERRCGRRALPFGEHVPAERPLRPRRGARARRALALGSDVAAGPDIAMPRVARRDDRGGEDPRDDGRPQPPCRRPRRPGD